MVTNLLTREMLWYWENDDWVSDLVIGCCGVAVVMDGDKEVMIVLTML